MDRETLELQKLQLEIDEIRKRVDSSPSTLRLEKFKIYPTYLAIAVSLILGTLTYFQQRQQFLDQQKREQTFKISQEMITLVKELNADNSPSMKRTAAIELSFFGLPAIPILIENLDIDHQREVYDAIIKGLGSVIISEKSADAVMTPLRESASNVFQREMNADYPTIRFMETHIRALGALSTMEGELNLGKQPDLIRNGVKSDLLKLKGNISQSRNQTIIDEKKNLLELIDSQVARIEAKKAA